ncbi:hypothetical protein Aph02nite_66650 [Actinoplanes philippinensis]|uniref:MmpS family transport accessory protein n=1 Tax=Actinoplanes philippinensis TaxID=35752 RepID=UPI000B848C44|nr:MmpS family transport accessory protein [Actinoplanes philippinensis]GIE80715.1 hypothetical protein Aph02nite_66650 [Actinoplanes philippinensis]
MTSLDDDGSTRHDAAASGPAKATTPDPDPVRLTPPADPWLTEAPTSAIADPATLQSFPNPATQSVPDPATQSFPDPATTTAGPDATLVDPAAPSYSGPVHGGPVQGSPVSGSPVSGGPVHGGWVPGGPAHGSPLKGGPVFATLERRRRRRPRRLLVAVLAGCAVFLAAILAVDLFGDHDGDDGARGVTPPAATTPSVAASPSDRTPASSSPAPADRASTAAATPADRSPAAAPADAGGPLVVYEVTASGSGNIGSIAYTDQDGDIIRRNGVPLPWRTTFPAGSQRHPLVLDAQRKGGGDAGPVTCTITVAGKVLATTTAEGRYGAPLCSGSA